MSWAKAIYSINIQKVCSPPAREAGRLTEVLHHPCSYLLNPNGTGKNQMAVSIIIK